MVKPLANKPKTNEKRCNMFQTPRNPSQTIAKHRKGDHNNKRIPALLLSARESPRTSRPAMRIPLALVIFTFAVGPVAAQQPKSDKTDFAHDVVPILKAKCAKCHTN